MPDVSETVSLLLTIFAGIGLASASGLRVFVPLLVLGLAVRLERVDVLESLTVLGSTPLLGVFALLSVLELVGRHRTRPLPGIRVQSVLAAFGGAAVAIPMLVDLRPEVALLVGGSAGAVVALAVQRPTSALRAVADSMGADAKAAGGLGTPAGETASSVLISVLSLYAPIAAPMLVVAVVAGSIHMRRQHVRRRAAA